MWSKFRRATALDHRTSKVISGGGGGLVQIGRGSMVLCRENGGPHKFMHAS